MYKPVCILVMAHSHEHLLLKLLHWLNHPQVWVFVHIDKKSGELFDRLNLEKNILLIKDRVDVKWAHISQVKAMFHSYREIVGLGHAFDHFLVISGQDFPVHPMQNLVEFLLSKKGKTLFGFAPLSKGGWSNARKRYQYYWYVPFAKWLRVIMMLTRLRRRFPLGLKPYGGPQWINLSREHMDYVVSYCERYPVLLQFLETTRFPEEMLFQTVLLNSTYKNDCMNEEMRIVKWSPQSSNPEILNGSDWDLIMASKDKFFARKFDIVKSAELIRKIEQHLQ